MQSHGEHTRKVERTVLTVTEVELLQPPSPASTHKQSSGPVMNDGVEGTGSTFTSHLTTVSQRTNSTSGRKSTPDPVLQRMRSKSFNHSDSESGPLSPPHAQEQMWSGARVSCCGKVPVQVYVLAGVHWLLFN